MRAWIVNRIKALPLPGTMATRVYTNITSPTKPFILVTMGIESTVLGMPVEARVQTIPFTVWIHDVPGSYVNIDDSALVLKNQLPTEQNFVIGGLSVYRIAWEETGQDAFDDHFGTNTRPVRFTAMTKHAAP